jgi:hypothetical protein
MAKAITRSSLWIIPDSGHGTVFGERWNEFLATTLGFLARPLSGRDNEGQRQDSLLMGRQG